MTYAHRMTPMMKLLVEPLIPKLQSMRPGDTLTLEAQSQEHLNQTRSQLYAWFSLTDNKRKFRTLQISSTFLQIVCIHTLPMQIRQDIPLSPIEDFVRDNLLIFNDEEVTRQFILRAVFNGEIKDEDVVPIMDEWRKKTGGGGDQEIIINNPDLIY